MTRRRQASAIERHERRHPALAGRRRRRHERRAGDHRRPRQRARRDGAASRRPRGGARRPGADRRRPRSPGRIGGRRRSVEPWPSRDRAARRWRSMPRPTRSRPRPPRPISPIGGRCCCARRCRARAARRPVRSSCSAIHRRPNSSAWSPIASSRCWPSSWRATSPDAATPRRPGAPTPCPATDRPGSP